MALPLDWDHLTAAEKKTIYSLDIKLIGSPREIAKSKILKICGKKLENVSEIIRDSNGVAIEIRVTATGKELEPIFKDLERHPNVAEIVTVDIPPGTQGTDGGSVTTFTELGFVLQESGTTTQTTDGAVLTFAVALVSSDLWGTTPGGIAYTNSDNPLPFSSVGESVFEIKFKLAPTGTCDFIIEAWNDLVRATGVVAYSPPEMEGDPNVAYLVMTTSYGSSVAVPLNLDTFYVLKFKLNQDGTVQYYVDGVLSATRTDSVININTGISLNMHTIGSVGMSRPATADSLVLDYVRWTKI